MVSDQTVLPPIGLEDDERRKYEAVYRDDPNYRKHCHSLNLWRARRDLFPAEFDSCIDIGCGLGYWFAAMNDGGRDAWAIDIAESSLADDVRDRWAHKRIVGPIWDDVHFREFDFGLCVDVMEHIPPGMIARTLASIYLACDRVLFLIANYPSKNPKTGEALHLTLEDWPFWLARMSTVGGTAELVEHRGQARGRHQYLIDWRCT